MEQLVVAQIEGGGLSVRGDALAASAAEGAEWMARSVGGDKILLERANLTQVATSGMAHCSVELFSDFLMGLHQQLWSGTVIVDVGQGVKRLFFEQGRLVFAGSNIMDDRLGEIIYRQGMITLDQLTDSAVRVDKKTKFGQVLLNRRIFSTVDLSIALRAQVKEILRSVFMSSSVYFEFRDGENQAPTQVVFSEGTRALLLECMCYGAAFRDFMRDTTDDTAVMLSASSEESAPNFGGTFLDDFVGLVREARTRKALVEASKLAPNGTLSYLMYLCHRGVCRVSPSDAGPSASGGRFEGGLSRLRAKIDAYTVLVPMVRKVFADNNVEFPIGDVTRFVSDLNPGEFVSLFLDEGCMLGTPSVRTIMAQSRHVPGRAEYFESRLESMIQFLLQVTGDLLPFSVAKALRASFRELTA